MSVVLPNGTVIDTDRRVPVTARNMRWYVQWLRHHRLDPAKFRYVTDLQGYRGPYVAVGGDHAYAVREHDGR